MKFSALFATWGKGWGRERNPTGTEQGLHLAQKVLMHPAGAWAALRSPCEIKRMPWV